MQHFEAMSRLKQWLGRLRGSSLQRRDYAVESKPPIENTDALTAAVSRQRDPIGGMGPSFPPNYVAPEDEGRPRH